MRVAKLLEQFRNKQLGQDQPTSSYEQPTPLQGDNGKMGFNFGSASNALQNPDLTLQQRQLIMQDAAKRGKMFYLHLNNQVLKMLLLMILNILKQ